MTKEIWQGGPCGIQLQEKQTRTCSFSSTASKSANTTQVAEVKEETVHKGKRTLKSQNHQVVRPCVSVNVVEKGSVGLHVYIIVQKDNGVKGELNEGSGSVRISATIHTIHVNYLERFT